MFNLLSGNDLRRLADALADQLARRDRRQVLVPERVLVPQPGLRRWLQIHLAERHGIIANVQFSQPAEFVWEMLRAAHPELPERSDFAAPLLRWRLLPLLDQMAAESNWPMITGYLRSAPVPLKRFQLAGELASAFERYQAYRSEQLLGWEAGEEPNDWQAELWRRVVRDSGQFQRVRQLHAYLQRYHQSSTPPPGLPARLFVFGCINVSPDVLRLFGVLGQHCQLDFYQPSPCREYWGDIRSERERLRDTGGELALGFETPANPLLASLGGVGRDFVAQLFSYEQVLTGEELELYTEPPTPTLLGQIQRDMLDLCAPEPVRQAPDGRDDHSLQVHCCHSPLREVQVLHDQLLALFAADASLQAREVAVMAPRIEDYAPLIRAVFGAPGPNDPRHIPFSVGDAPAHTEHPIVKLFMALLSLPASRRSASEVLELLRVPAVLRRLEMDSAALDQVIAWVAATGIRWGTNAPFRAAHGAGHYAEFSWAWGIDRLLMGYASNLSSAPIAGVVPYVEIEGLAAEALGKLIQVLRVLETLARSQRQALPAQAWQQVLNSALAALLPEEAEAADERHALALIRAALAALSDDSQASGVPEFPLDWMSVRAFLGEQLAEVGSQQRFLSGGVSFCGMVPLRTVPFRVICVLGMDATAFPRQDPAGGINRMHLDYALKGKRKLGDRSLREDDRYLFLQLLSAAQDVFYLSYVAHNLRDGSIREPSVLLSELLEVATRGYFLPDAVAAARATLITQHAMQPFARRLFERSEPRLVTYNQHWHAAARVHGIQAEPAPFVDGVLSKVTASEVTLEQLLKFFRNPAQYFLQQCLHLQLPKAAPDDLDEDPLMLDHLADYQLKEALVAAELDSGATPNAAVLAAQLTLPAGTLGKEAQKNATLASAELRAALQSWCAGQQPQSAPAFCISLADGSQLSGQLDQYYPQGLLDWWPGQLHGKPRLHAWLRFLCLRAADLGEHAVLFGLAPQGGVQALSWRPISVAYAREELQKLVALYRQGCAQPLPFYPKTAWQLVSLLQDPTTQEYQAWQKAGSVFEGGYQTRGERDDPWIALATRGTEPFAGSMQSAQGAHIKAVALGVFVPLLGGGMTREC